MYWDMLTIMIFMDHFQTEYWSDGDLRPKQSNFASSLVQRPPQHLASSSALILTGQILHYCLCWHRKKLNLGVPQIRKVVFDCLPKYVVHFQVIWGPGKLNWRVMTCDVSFVFVVVKYVFMSIRLISDADFWEQPNPDTVIVFLFAFSLIWFDLIRNRNPKKSGCEMSWLVQPNQENNAGVDKKEGRVFNPWISQ